MKLSLLAELRDRTISCYMSLFFLFLQCVKINVSTASLLSLCSEDLGRYTPAKSALRNADTDVCVGVLFVFSAVADTSQRTSSIAWSIVCGLNR